MQNAGIIVGGLLVLYFIFRFATKKKRRAAKGRMVLVVAQGASPAQRNAAVSGRTWQAFWIFAITLILMYGGIVVTAFSPSDDDRVLAFLGGMVVGFVGIMGGLKRMPDDEAGFGPRMFSIIVVLFAGLGFMGYFVLAAPLSDWLQEMING